MLNREVPVLSTRAVMKVLEAMKPRELNRDSTYYDVGYEAAKRDFARIVGRELGLDFSNNPANELLKQMRRSDEA